MPRYTYFCSECEREFETIHSMSEDLKECLLCETANKVTKIPSLIGSSDFGNKIKKTGEVVNRHIKGAKDDLKSQKKELRKKTVK